MAQGDIDRLEAGLAGAFLAASLVTLGIGTVELYGFNFGETVFTAMGADFSVATLVALGSLGLAYLTNDPTMSELETEYRAAAIITAGLLVAVPFSPQLGDVLTQNDTIKIVVVLIETLGYMAVAYFG